MDQKIVEIINKGQMMKKACAELGIGGISMPSWIDAACAALRDQSPTDFTNEVVEKLSNDHDRLRNELTLLRQKMSGGYWVWQDDGSNDISTLTCPILITPHQMQCLFDSYEVRIRDAASATAGAHEYNSNLRRELAIANDTNASLRTGIAEANAAISTRDEQLKRAAHSMKELADSIEELKDEVVALSEERDSLLATNTYHEGQLVAADLQCQKLRDELDKERALACPHCGQFPGVEAVVDAHIKAAKEPTGNVSSSLFEMPAQHKTHVSVQRAADILRQTAHDAAADSRQKYFDVADTLLTIAGYAAMLRSHLKTALNTVHTQAETLKSYANPVKRDSAWAEVVKKTLDQHLKQRRQEMIEELSQSLRLKHQAGVAGYTGPVPDFDTMIHPIETPVPQQPKYPMTPGKAAEWLDGSARNFTALSDTYSAKKSEECATTIRDMEKYIQELAGFANSRTASCEYLHGRLNDAEGIIEKVRAELQLAFDAPNENRIIGPVMRCRAIIDDYRNAPIDIEALQASGRVPPPSPITDAILSRSIAINDHIDDLRCWVRDYIDINKSDVSMKHTLASWHYVLTQLENLPMVTMTNREGQMAGLVTDLEAARREIEELKRTKQTVREAELFKMQMTISDERKRRIYYQDIAYNVCNNIDRITGRGSHDIVCGTFDKPSTAVQLFMEKLVFDIGHVRSRLSQIVTAAQHALSYNVADKAGLIIKLAEIAIEQLSGKPAAQPPGKPFQEGEGG